MPLRPLETWQLSLIFNTSCQLHIAKTPEPDVTKIIVMLINSWK